MLNNLAPTKSLTKKLYGFFLVLQMGLDKLVYVFIGWALIFGLYKHLILFIMHMIRKYKKKSLYKYCLLYRGALYISKRRYMHHYKYIDDTRV